jgi:GT2 family glycosyltransferase
VIAVVVVTWNSRDDVGPCLRSLEAVTLPLEVVVVDNASEDRTAALVRQDFPSVRVIDAGSNLGFAKACNLGFRTTSAPLVLFLNPDACVEAGAVEALSAVLSRRPDVGIVGPATRNQDGTPQVSFGPDLTPWNEWRQRRLVRGVAAREPAVLREVEALCAREHEPDWVSGSCLLARRSLLDRLSGFDEGFFLYEEDADLCLRARQAGARVVFTPRARAVHRQGRSMERSAGRAGREYDRSHRLYYRKHGNPLSRAALFVWLAVRRLTGR